mmetsp:Transcript_24719/g.69391  ORF Transcript_24719/g.69391 Transcript_24719/m.69391 type:complete len:258 (-) Transcript_24719:448-1221(-)
MPVQARRHTSIGQPTGVLGLRRRPHRRAHRLDREPAEERQRTAGRTLHPGPHGLHGCQRNPRHLLQDRRHQVHVPPAPRELQGIVPNVRRQEVRTGLRAAAVRARILHVDLDVRTEQVLQHPLGLRQGQRPRCRPGRARLVGTAREGRSRGPLRSPKPCHLHRRGRPGAGRCAQERRKDLPHRNDDLRPDEGDRLVEGQTVHRPGPCGRLRDPSQAPQRELQGDEPLGGVQVRDRDWIPAVGIHPHRGLLQGERPHV